LTLAPQTVWELLGSRIIQDVTLTSSEVRLTEHLPLVLLLAPAQQLMCPD
jgi:hypothetical protein